MEKMSFKDKMWIKWKTIKYLTPYHVKSVKDDKHPKRLLTINIDEFSTWSHMAFCVHKFDATRLINHPILAIKEGRVIPHTSQSKYASSKR